MVSTKEIKTAVKDRIQLPFNYDVSKMQKETKALALEHFEYYKVIQLRGPAHLIDTSLTFPPPAEDYADGSWTDWLNTPELDKSPYLKSIINYFKENTTVTLVRLLRLAPNSVVILDHINWSSLEEGKSSRLDILQQFLQRQSQLRVRLAIHTDTRGHEGLNLDRSIELGQLAKDYLVARGISADRLEIVGLGERFPRNPCMEGQNCSEEDHAANNRVELRILE